MSTGLLAIAAIILFFVVIFYIAKTSELSSLVKGDADDYTYASKVNGILSLVFLIAGFIGVGLCFWYLSPRMIPAAASYHGEDIVSMFNVTNIITVLIFIFTHIALLGFVFVFRYKKDRPKYFFPHSNALEAVWTIIPAIVLTFLVVRGIKVWDEIFDFSTVQDVTTGQPYDDVLVFEATAKQFGWTLRYPGEDGQLGSREITQERISPINELGVVWEDEASHDDIYANKVMLVKDKPTLALLGAQDVLHGFYLPHFRVKMDCVPGLPTKFAFTPKYTTVEYREMLSKKTFWQQINPETGEERWKTFNFELACTELCGRSHYGMQKYVEVVTQEEYDAWVTEQSAKSYYKTVVNPVAANAEVINDVIIEEETILDELEDAGMEDQLQQLPPDEVEEYEDDITASNNN